MPPEPRNSGQRRDRSGTVRKEAVRANVSSPTLAAVLFDMDGVVTDTAGAHAEAWQRLFDDYLRQRAERGEEKLPPFDPDRDYRRYVDGKPREAGVRSFLEARGIEIPYGDESDPPERESIWGLAKRKDRYFRSWLAENRVTVYPGSRRLIDELSSRGLKTAIFSASRNAAEVLANAGVDKLFDTKVDGRDLAALGLPGKPEPAMLLEAAARLGVAPEQAAVLEDAIAGVEAGARGGFGLVIGVARGDYGEELQKAGARMVVHDLAELALDGDNTLFVKTLADLPSVAEAREGIRERLTAKKPAVFLDYDGTLTPIVEDHTKALLGEGMRAAVAELARHCKVAVVSGRDLAMLKQLVGIESVFYAGSHGFEIVGPDGWNKTLEKGAEFLPELDRAEKSLQSELAGIKDHAVERKRFSIAVHYRRVADADLPRLEEAVERVLADHRSLKLGHGKKVFEIQPEIAWNKGRAVLWLLEQLDLEHSDVVPLYIGDDITDEDAFRVLAGCGLAIAVRDHESRPTAADCTLADPEEVRRFLEFLTTLVAGRQGQPPGRG
ncbi:beta-phosphoglucomutase family hydrolase [Desulfurivibrio alkaliphilus AHT 2]|uniref:Trehalose 6-phosphate phosphatase n=1 Tax=Desulfurivibrio alkaliphilus (strain DSM 19089 / UNIQEM U267 / AHT2) TaxID=589865 RepID=D6Z5X3_DESAT|nr:trehalose-phosphatase [Desulfurivibrio alkaliphilus]ADH84855.1 beta-phosphoglucomutase family hydrolase [Desulfurivibrio alkaliphilus AHT 2]